MCLTSKKEFKFKIAEKDIICFKELFKDNTSYFTDYEYIKGVKNPIEDLVSIYDDFSINAFSIYEGYHSNVKNENCNALFIIPKGTKYTEGFNNNSKIKNYVSETIIFIGKNTFWNRLKAKFGKYV